MLPLPHPPKTSRRALEERGGKRGKLRAPRPRARARPVNTPLDPSFNLSGGRGEGWWMVWRRLFSTGGNGAGQPPLWGLAQRPLTNPRCNTRKQHAIWLLSEGGAHHPCGGTSSLVVVDGFVASASTGWGRRERGGVVMRCGRRGVKSVPLREDAFFSRRCLVPDAGRAAAARPSAAACCLLPAAAGARPPHSNRRSRSALSRRLLAPPIAGAPPPFSHRHRRPLFAPSADDGRAHPRSGARGRRSACTAPWSSCRRGRRSASARTPSCCRVCLLMTMMMVWCVEMEGGWVSMPPADYDTCTLLLLFAIALPPRLCCDPAQAPVLSLRERRAALAARRAARAMLRRSAAPQALRAPHMLKQPWHLTSCC